MENLYLLSETEVSTLVNALSSIDAISETERERIEKLIKYFESKSKK